MIINRFNRVLATATFALLLATSSYAQTTWISGGNTDWNLPGNWSTGVPSLANEAVFDGTGTVNPVVSGTVQTLGIDVTAGQAVNRDITNANASARLEIGANGITTNHSNGIFEVNIGIDVITNGQVWEQNDEKLQLRGIDLNGNGLTIDVNSTVRLDMFGSVTDSVGGGSLEIGGGGSVEVRNGPWTFTGGLTITDGSRVSDLSNGNDADFNVDMTIELASIFEADDSGVVVNGNMTLTDGSSFHADNNVVVNGDISLDSTSSILMNLDSAATLTHNGTLIYDDSTLAFGSNDTADIGGLDSVNGATDALTVSGNSNATLNLTGTLAFEIAGTGDNDMVDMTGNANLDLTGSVIDVTLLGYSPANFETFVLFNDAGSITGTPTAPTGFSFTIVQDGANFDGILTAVPEPSSLALLALAGTVMLRRWRAKTA